MLSFSVLALPTITQVNVQPHVGDSYTNLTKGDTFETSASDIVKFKIWTKNINSNNRSTNNLTLKVEGMSIEETTDSFVLENNEEQQQTISFSIPSGANEDSYRVRIYLNAMVNGTYYPNQEINSYWMDVKDEISSQNDFYKNLTNTCTQSVVTSITLIDKINTTLDYADRWGICLKQLGEAQQKAIVGDDYKNQSQTCDTKADGYKTTITTLNTQISNMVTTAQCDANINAAVAKKQNDLTTYGVVIAIAAIIFYNNYWKKRGLAQGGGQGTPLHSA
jgi:hypothetical protein